MLEMAVMQSGLTLADGENKSSLAKRKNGKLALINSYIPSEQHIRNFSRTKTCPAHS